MYTLNVSAKLPSKVKQPTSKDCLNKLAEAQCLNKTYRLTKSKSL